MNIQPVLCPEAGDDAESFPVDGTAIPFEVVKIAELQKGTANPVIRPGDLIWLPKPNRFTLRAA